jgi:DNA polymerase III sliding clamp (beta) subunit (PCNA family)
LKSVLKIASITERLEVSLKTDHPIKMEFDLLEGGELAQFIAPRVEDQEFEDEDMEEF